jgi:hypothetical protein
MHVICCKESNDSARVICLSGILLYSKRVIATLTRSHPCRPLVAFDSPSFVQLGR